MTAPNKPNPQNYTLELCFAAEQITESLQFCFYDAKDNPCTELPHGPLASTFNFQEGDTITVKVMGSAQGKSKEVGMPNFKMAINNCTLVSIPPTSVSDLSMFDPQNAVTKIGKWGKPDIEEDEESLTVSITTQSRKPLEVTANTGQWKISGYLSVTETLNGKTANKLYYFDPEGSTGQGGWGPD